MANSGEVTDESAEPNSETAEESEKDKTDSSLTRFKIGAQSEDVMWIYEIGCVSKVLQLSRSTPKEGSGVQFSMLVEGVTRCRAVQVIKEEPFFLLQMQFPQTRIQPNSNTEIIALASHVKRTSRDLLELLKKRNTMVASKTKEVLETVDRAPPELLVDVLTSSNGDATMKEKQQVLGEIVLSKRLRKALDLLNRQVEVLEMSDKIQSRVDGKLKSSQREYYLRQQQKAITEELNQITGTKEAEDEIVVLERSLSNVPLSPEARTVADRELTRIKNMQSSSPDYSVIRTYLEWLADLPWGKFTSDNLDVENAQKQLDEDHFGLDQVKKRMIEFLAVRSLKSDTKGPILCLVGPPGVGKTSLGRSIAQAVGRQFRRLALGGVRDEAEIRGHRRTYIGALPGNIMQSIKKSGTSNPVILLDEIDKLGNNVRGDPSSALLEVLDPEQNGTFTDHYLNVSYDLSKVMFIATANDPSTIPAPLLDRMEMIEVPGYSMHEKVQIAERHLVTKQIERHGITEEHIKFSQEGISQILEGYTREAGVRQLDREIAACCRYVAVKVAQARDKFRATEQAEKERSTGDSSIPEEIASLGADAPTASGEDNSVVDAEVLGRPEEPLRLLGFEPFTLNRDLVKQILGPIKYENEVAARTAIPGVSTGMAWTQVGGEILFVEVSLSKGNGKIQVTGRLGETMQESVKTALSYVKGNTDELGLNLHQDLFEEDIEYSLRFADLHVHFPQGAVPKDGPSAGVAIIAALVSALSGQCVRNDTACTGEVTLRGLVLPVGGIKEKVLAAHRAGIRRVVLPARNEKDTLEIPTEVRDELQICYASSIYQAMGYLLDHDTEAKPPAWRIRLQALMKAEQRRKLQPHTVKESIDEEDRAGGGERLGFKEDFTGDVFRSFL